MLSGVTERALRVEAIEDPSDPRIHDYRDLDDSRLRLRQGTFIAESRTVVRRLIESRRFRVRSVLLTPPALEPLRDVLETARPAPRILVARHELIRSVAGFPFHRGCLAVGERGESTPADALIAPAGPRLLVLLDQVTNPDNVGGVFRNALAFGADGVLLSAGSVDPLYRKTIRVSVGGSLYLPFARLPDWAAGLARLKAAGYTVIALTPGDGALDLADLGTRGPRSRVALVVGSEGDGLGEATRAAADLSVRIRMRPGVDSLNVATATGIALHHLDGLIPRL